MVQCTVETAVPSPDTSGAELVPTKLYCITNSVNGKMYVGVTKGPLRRLWREHKSAAHRMSPLRIYKAIRKYGIDSFSMIQLCVYDTYSAALAAEVQLIASLDLTRLGYNISPGGDTPNLGQVFSAERRAQISAFHTGRKHTAEARAKISAALSGRKLSDKHRASLSTARQGITFTDEHRANLSAARSLRPARNTRPHTAEAKRKMSASRRAHMLWQEERGSVNV